MHLKKVVVQKPFFTVNKSNVKWRKDSGIWKLLLFNFVTRLITPTGVCSLQRAAVITHPKTFPLGSHFEHLFQTIWIVNNNRKQYATMLPLLADRLGEVDCSVLKNSRVNRLPCHIAICEHSITFCTIVCI